MYIISNIYIYIHKYPTSAANKNRQGQGREGHQGREGREGHQGREDHQGRQGRQGQGRQGWLWVVHGSP